MSSAHDSPGPAFNLRIKLKPVTGIYPFPGYTIIFCSAFPAFSAIGAFEEPYIRKCKKNMICIKRIINNGVPGGHLKSPGSPASVYTPGINLLPCFATIGCFYRTSEVCCETDIRIYGRDSNAEWIFSPGRAKPFIQRIAAEIG